MWHIHDLLDVINNRGKFQLNRMRTYNFQIKRFDIGVTFKMRSRSLKVV